MSRSRVFPKDAFRSEHRPGYTDWHYQRYYYSISEPGYRWMREQGPDQRAHLFEVPVKLGINIAVCGEMGGNPREWLTALIEPEREDKCSLCQRFWLMVELAE